MVFKVKQRSQRDYFDMIPEQADNASRQIFGDQKSPQDTRLINRLNFYSGKDITDLLTKCLPHFKLKQKNANVLLELIKIKKENKKADWYKGRKEELFKLMKYYNHSDNTRFDWKAWNIDIDNITKLEENSKMEA